MFSLIIQLIVALALFLTIVEQIQSLLEISYKKSFIFTFIFLTVSILIIRLSFGVKISLGEWLI